MNMYVVNKILKRILLYLSVILIIVFFLFPIYWIFISSIQENNAIYVRNPNFIPRNITLTNYIAVLTGKGKIMGAQTGILHALFNTILIAIIVSFFCILIGILTSYAFARLNFKWKNGAFIGIIFIEMLPTISLILPLRFLFQFLHLIDTLVGVMIIQVAIFLPLTIWILYSYFKTIPQELEDSARIDGCTRVGAIFKIFLPISYPGVISAGIIAFIFSMNNFLPVLIIINSTRNQTLTFALASFNFKDFFGFGNIAAGAICSIIFPIIIVVIFQKYIIKGLTSGAVKG